MKRNKTLSVMERNFVNNYSAHGDGARSARDAGYSARTAATQASRLLKRVHVKRALAEIMDAATEKASIDASWVLREAVQLYQRCIQEIRPAVDRKGKPMTDHKGQPVYTFNAAVAARALEIVGRTREVAAFSDRVEVDDTSAVIAALQAGRRRAAGILIDAEPDNVTSAALQAGRRRVALPKPNDEEID